MYVSIHNYGQASPVLAGALTALFVLTLSILFALPFFLYRLAIRPPRDSSSAHQPWLQLLGFPAIWVLGEGFRSWFLTGFPWLLLGYSTIDTWLSGWAPLLGVYGVGGIAALSASTLSLLFARLKHKAGLAGIFLTLFFWIVGWQLQSATWTTPDSPTLRLALIQPNHPVLEKWQADKLPAFLQRFAQINAQYPNSDLIIWPEAAIPRFKQDVQGFLDQQDQLAQQNDTGILLGIPVADGDRYYNSVLGLGTARGKYHKQHLVPFGEYVPLEQWLRQTIAFFNLPMSGFSAGPKNQTPLSLHGRIKIATAICYEIVYPDLFARNARQTNLLLTVSNDTWFGRSIGPHQHLQMARMRALEHQKPLLRATNDGITAIITHQGKIEKTIPSFSAGTLLGEVQVRQGHTPFAQTGSLPSFFLSLILLLGLKAYCRSVLPPR